MPLPSVSHVGGGCINETVKCECTQGVFFIKSSHHCPSDFFEKEAKGLQLLHYAQAINTPKIIQHGKIGHTYYLALEWIEKGRTTEGFWTEFGRKMAELHQVSQPEFGLDHDNYIGRLKQQNHFYDNWINFFIEQRILPQLKLAINHRKIDHSVQQSFDRLFGKLSDLMPTEPPALLHGDLWSGNFMCNTHEQPILIDPAVYYGHREMELAFTHLFGGFDSLFYKAYQEAYPLTPGFPERIEVYNLYPLLVHVNLFGQSYLHDVMQTLRRLA